MPPELPNPAAPCPLGVPDARGKGVRRAGDGAQRATSTVPSAEVPAKRQLLGLHPRHRTALMVPRTPREHRPAPFWESQAAARKVVFGDRSPKERATGWSGFATSYGRGTAAGLVP